MTGDNDPIVEPPRPTSADDVVGAAEQVAYDAACSCDDTYGDNASCRVCYPTNDCDRCMRTIEREIGMTPQRLAKHHDLWHTGRSFVPGGNRRFA